MLHFKTLCRNKVAALWRCLNTLKIEFRCTWGILFSNLEKSKFVAKITCFHSYLIFILQTKSYSTWISILFPANLLLVFLCDVSVSNYLVLFLLGHLSGKKISTFSPLKLISHCWISNACFYLFFVKLLIKRLKNHYYRRLSPSD